ncbi:MAG: HypX (modular protein) [Crocosphaera sp.]|nr:HypX (modular protein) [Crocosphaera sp.]
MTKSTSQTHKENEHNRNISIYRYLLEHLTEFNLSKDRNNNDIPNEYQIAKQWGQNRTYIRRVLRTALPEYYPKEQLEKETVPGLTVEKLIDILEAIQNYGKQQQNNLPDEQIHPVLTQQEKIKVLKKFVQLLPEEKERLGIKNHPQEALLDNLQSIIINEIRGLNSEQIITFYKQAIVIYNALRKESISSDNEWSLDQKIKEIIETYLSIYYSQVNSVKKEKKINILCDKVAKEISKINLQSGLKHDQILGFQNKYKKLESYSSFLEDLIYPIVDNDLLGDKLPIYIHHFEFKKVGSLPFPTYNKNNDTGLLNPKFLSNTSEEELDYIKGLEKQITYQVRVYFYVNLKRYPWKTEFTSEIEGIYKKEEQRLEFFEEVRGMGSPISLILKAINKFLFENIPLLKDYFPVAQEILNEDKIMGANTHSPIRSYTLIRLCLKQDIEKAREYDLDYNEVAAEKELSHGEYCGFDLVEVTAKSSLYAKLRAIEKAGIDCQEYLKQLCDSIQEKHFLRTAKSYLQSYPFSLRVMEAYLEETIFKKKYLYRNENTNQFIHIQEIEPWSVIAYEAYLKIVQAYLQEGLRRKAKHYLDIIQSHIEDKKLDDPMLITLYYLCQFRYHFLTDIKDLEERDYEQREHAILEAEDYLDKAEDTLKLFVDRHKIIEQPSQVNAHPFYHLLSRINAHRAKIYIFFPKSGKASKSDREYERLIKPIKLLEKARIQAAVDGNGNHYAYWTIYQIWCYLIAGYLNTSKGIDNEFSLTKCIKKSKQLLNHGLSCYAELGQIYYQQIKSHSGKEKNSDTVKDKDEKDLFYEKYKYVYIETIPPVISGREDSVRLLEQLDDKDGSEKEENKPCFLFLDMSILTKTLKQPQDDFNLTNDSNTVYLFGVYSSILLFGLGIVELCDNQWDDDNNKLEENLIKAMKYFTLCAAIAADGGNDYLEDGKIYFKRKFATKTESNQPKEFKIRGLYPHRLTHFTVLGKIFAATCKVILTLHNQEKNQYWGEIEYLLKDLHEDLDSEETIKKSKEYVFNQKRYNGHLEIQLKNIKTYLESYQNSKSEYGNIAEIRNLIVRDVFKIIRGDKVRSSRA